MKQFKQIYGMGAGYVFRLALPAHRFVSFEVFDTAEDAAFYCDVFKSYLVKSYRLTGVSMHPSLAPSAFLSRVREAGVDPAVASELFNLVPESCKEYLAISGHETLTEYAKAQEEIKASGGKAFR